MSSLPRQPRLAPSIPSPRTLLIVSRRYVPASLRLYPSVCMLHLVAPACASAWLRPGVAANQSTYFTLSHCDTVISYHAAQGPDEWSGMRGGVARRRSTVPVRLRGLALSRRAGLRGASAFASADTAGLEMFSKGACGAASKQASRCPAVGFLAAAGRARLTHSRCRSVDWAGLGWACAGDDRPIQKKGAHLWEEKAGLGGSFAPSEVQVHESGGQIVEPPERPDQVTTDPDRRLAYPLIQVEPDYSPPAGPEVRRSITGVCGADAWALLPRFVQYA